MKLKIRDYTKQIKDTVILDKINLELESSNIYGFYGRNASDKTMLYTINNKKDSDYINSVLERAGLQDAGNKKLKEYSLGMKQRLRIAQAFMENQKIIILDEPTNGIDEEGIEVIRKIIEDEKKQGKLILLASHNKEDLRQLCDYIYKIDHGKIKGLLDGELEL